jgi:hypothetical protein
VGLPNGKTWDGMVSTQQLAQTEHGIVPTGDDGWFVLNATDARWRVRPGRGCVVWQLGLNIQRLGPGEPGWLPD